MSNTKEVREVKVSDLILTDKIHPSPELVRNIRERGILVELRVRPKGKKYIVDAGRRRALAAKIIGLETVPCIIGPELTSEDLLSENHLRKPNPISDLRYLEDLMINEGLSEKEIAQRTGMAVGTQRKRLKLRNLIEPIAVALTELTEQGRPRLTLPLAERIAQLTKAQQKKLARTLEEAGKITQGDYRDLRATTAKEITLDLFSDLNMVIKEG